MDGEPKSRKSESSTVVKSRKSEPPKDRSSTPAYSVTDASDAVDVALADVFKSLPRDVLGGAILERSK